MWTQWFVLAACAVITQSFPRPVDEYEIPVEQYPGGSQYYFLRDNGDFRYGYNAENGAYESAVKRGSGDVIGYFGYIDANGKNVRLDYTAGVGGFVPRSSLLPVAPQVDAASVRSAVSGSADVASGVITQSEALSGPFVEPDVRSAINLDGSYSSQSEPADSSANVVGQKFFVKVDGENQQVRNSAESGTAYVAKGESIQVVLEAPTGSVGQEFSVEDDRQNPQIRNSVESGTAYVAKGESIQVVLEAPTGSVGQEFFVEDDRQNPQIRNSAESGTGYVAKGDSIQVVLETPTGSVGQEFIVENDGKDKQIRSSAESATNYVAQGDSIEAAPEGPAGPAGRSVFASTYSTHKASVPVDIYGMPVGISGRSIQQTIHPRGDASFSFKFPEPDRSREESADRDLNVKERFNFIADDVIKRKSNYIAGSATGFVADGDNSLVAPEATGAFASVSTGASQATVYSGLGSSSFSSSDGSSASSEMASDASFSSKYDASVDSLRGETADTNLNVRKQYSLDAADGVTGTGQYTAGSGIKFEAEGARLPGPVSDIARAKSGSTGNQLGFPGVPSFRKQDVLGDVLFEISPGNDGSYRFSYTNPDTYRSEYADSDLNVRGAYSFIADDGIERHIQYRAGSGTGFVAEGDHLPVPVLDTTSIATSESAGI